MIGLIKQGTSGKMKVTKRQLRRIIKEELTRELQRLAEGYMVPEFPNTDSMFILGLIGFLMLVLMDNVLPSFFSWLTN